MPLDREGDIPRGAQVHLDAAEHVVPARFMDERTWRDGAVEFPVHPLDEVEVERRRDALGVVIGRDQALDRLDPIHADQQARAGAEQRAEMPQQVGRAAGNEIADRRAGEEAELGHRRDLGGKGQLPGEIGNDGEDGEMERVVDHPGAFVEIIPADVDRDISGGMDRFEQQRSLGCRSGTELDHCQAGGECRDDLRHDAREQRGLGPRRIIDVEPGDFVEQLGASTIVEPTCRDRRNWLGKATQDIVAEGGIDFLPAKRRHMGDGQPISLEQDAPR